MSAVRIDLRCALVMVLGLLAGLLRRSAQGVRLFLRPPGAAGVILGLLLLSRRYLCGAIGATSRLGRCVVKALRLRPARASLDAVVTSLVANAATAQGQGDDRQHQNHGDDDDYQHGSIHVPQLPVRLARWRG
jgi:hypothetical protein